jgi:hypothetical protein
MGWPTAFEHGSLDLWRSELGIHLRSGTRTSA